MDKPIQFTPYPYDWKTLIMFYFFVSLSASIGKLCKYNDHASKAAATVYSVLPSNGKIWRSKKLKLVAEKQQPRLFLFVHPRPYNIIQPTTWSLYLAPQKTAPQRPKHPNCPARRIDAVDIAIFAPHEDASLFEPEFDGLPSIAAEGLGSEEQG